MDHVGDERHATPRRIQESVSSQEADESTHQVVPERGFDGKPSSTFSAFLPPKTTHFPGIDDANIIRKIYVKKVHIKKPLATILNGAVS